MSIDVIDIAALILPDWEIEGTTNLPLHRIACGSSNMSGRIFKEGLYLSILSVKRSTGDECYMTR
jgi:hypothetical protein